MPFPFAFAWLNVLQAVRHSLSIHDKTNQDNNRKHPPTEKNTDLIDLTAPPINAFPQGPLDNTNPPNGSSTMPSSQTVSPPPPNNHNNLKLKHLKRHMPPDFTHLKPHSCTQPPINKDRTRKRI
jgi:hypothetical protein